MAADNPQFTDLTVDPPPSVPQSSTNNRYRENSKTNGTSVFQSKWLTIILFVVVLGLLIVCIALAIALAAVVKSNDSKTNTVFSSTPSPTTMSNLGNCGRQEIQPNPSLDRIFGGIEAVPHSWPWIVLYYQEGSCVNGNCSGALCGGTLIDRQYVLTAAHCIAALTNSTIYILAGLHSKESTSEQNIRQVTTVDLISMHPAYNSTVLTNDIAVLHLRVPFNLTKYVQVACLPGREPQVGDNVIAAGWGKETLTGEVSDILMQATTEVVGNCADLWEGDAPIDERRQICVANVQTGASVCPGDSGGPLLVKHGQQWVMSGVTSFILDCNTTNNIPNVFTRVSYYLPWINQIIQ